jgi:hypothetical protein
MEGPLVCLGRHTTSCVVEDMAQMVLANWGSSGRKAAACNGYQLRTEGEGDR